MKKTTLLPKKELQRQLNEIAEKELKDLIDKHYPKFKELEGKYFKSTNSYGGGKSWWVYTKITSIKREDVYDTRGNGPACHFTGWSFQTDSYGKIEVETQTKGHIHYIGNQITEVEFKSAWKKVIEKIESL